RAALDVHPLRLVVELLLGAALRPVRPGALAPAPAGRHVLPRRARRLTRLAGPGALLVDCPRRDLLGALGRAALLALALLDVLVLPLPLLARGLRRHQAPPRLLGGPIPGAADL